MGVARRAGTREGSTTTEVRVSATRDIEHNKPIIWSWSSTRSTLLFKYATPASICLFPMAGPTDLELRLNASENDKVVQNPPQAKQSTSTIFNRRLLAVSLSLSPLHLYEGIVHAIIFPQQLALRIGGLPAACCLVFPSTPRPNNVGLNNLLFSVRHNGVSESRRYKSMSSNLTRRLQSRSTAQLYPNPAAKLTLFTFHSTNVNSPLVSSQRGILKRLPQYPRSTKPSWQLTNAPTIDEPTNSLPAFRAN
ncbi:hypothetical protein Hypma_003426 [Hypsizygus marmoreus]|uniref:Uncharacterized protein n=1 Tax=Hypsizygus marmoreus TaxID=39966 RepID=A0A369J8I4_HYPMA|nr:hypothetical protein Hypma_003426 [Hypsizygus marmoreus]